MRLNIFDMARLIVCVTVALIFIVQAFEMMKNVSVITQTFSLVPLGFGFLLLIYGFSPDMAKQIIKAIIEIIRIPVEAIFQ